MPAQYNQLKAMLAITKASLRAMLRSPSSVIFSIFFPLIFILVFGFIGSSGKLSLNIAIDKRSDTTNEVYYAIKHISALSVKDKDPKSLMEDLEKGRITAILNIQKTTDPAAPYQLNLKSSEAANPQNLQVLQSLLNSVIEGINKQKFPAKTTYAVLNNDVQKVPGRVYRTIDFILPGQLGFSLLSAGVFGVAFLFFSLRQQVVLKRFYATPIKRTYIILGEGLSRVIFQLLTAVIIVGVGHYLFKFTLIHGWVTFLEILALSFLALLVFMSFGFIISGLARNESSIPPIANIFTLPQFLLAGTFFSIDVFPTWLQPISRSLPLTYFNDAMRKISFEGAHLSDCLLEIGVLVAWGLLGYFIAIKVFRWE
ncbi:MAG: ABC transporter permease [Chitinophagaceae bacterium]